MGLVDEIEKLSKRNGVGRGDEDSNWEGKKTENGRHVENKGTSRRPLPPARRRTSSLPSERGTGKKARAHQPTARSAKRLEREGRMQRDETDTHRLNLRVELPERLNRNESRGDLPQVEFHPH